MKIITHTIAFTIPLFLACTSSTADEKLSYFDAQVIIAPAVCERHLKCSPNTFTYASVDACTDTLLSVAENVDQGPRCFTRSIARGCADAMRNEACDGELAPCMCDE